MIKRLLEEKIISNLKPNKVNLLFGARRVGKTFLIKEIIKKVNYKHLLLNGEDFDAQSLLEPQSISNYKRLLNGIELLVIDEAQNIADIGKKLKLIVDEVKNIRIIASGSSSFDLLNKAGEPLVGRSFNYFLFPFSQSELSPYENILETRQRLENRLLYGSYPEIENFELIEDKQNYLREISNAYLLKDILSLDGIKNSSKMAQLLKLLAFQVGSEVSLDELAKSTSLSRNTVEKYLDLLTKVFVIFKIGGYSNNLRKEVSKSHKWYFYDNGIRNQLISNFNPLNLRNDLGQIWENYLISERLKINFYQKQYTKFYFWRTYDKQEIDLIEEHNNKLKAFEFKWGNKTPKAPRAFSTNYPDAEFNVINRENYLDFI